MSRRFAKVMGAQLKAFHRDDHPYLQVAVSEADCGTWHFLVTGLPPDSPHAGGEYIFRLRAPNTGDTVFPYHPPSFEFLTPSGVYVPGGKICISIGEFHADDSPGKHGGYGWRPALGMRGFAREVVNGLTNPEGLEGIRIKVLSRAATVKLAKESREYNRAYHPELLAEFAENAGPAAAAKK